MKRWKRESKEYHLIVITRDGNENARLVGNSCGLQNFPSEPSTTAFHRQRRNLLHLHLCASWDGRVLFSCRGNASR